MDKIEENKEVIIKCLMDNLDTLVLVGSFARGEAVEGVSDIEFWAVVKDITKVQKPEFEDDVSLGFTTRSHLAKLKPYIFTVEVKKFGKVLYGDNDILNLIPDYSFEDILPIDGFVLLNNRIVEQFILLNKIEGGKTINQYEFDKGYIQLVSSLLIIKRKYKGLYKEKLEEFRKLYKNEELGILPRIEEAFASISQGSMARIPPADALKKWLDLRECFRKVWLEEMKILSGFSVWSRIIKTGRIDRFSIYRKASSLYFSNTYQNRGLRDKVVQRWEKFVK